MKKQFLKMSTMLFVGVMSLYSCSSDESGDNLGDPPVINQFISNIQNENPQSFERANQFFYENEQLVFIYLYDCSGTLYYFEYNSNGKVSKRYEGTITLNSDEFNPNEFDLISFQQNSTVLNYIYEEGKLTRMQSNNGFVDYQLTYNSNDELTVIEYFLPNIGAWEKVEISYLNGKINNLNKKEYDTTGELSSNYDYTFEFDDKPNPFNVLNEVYSLVSVYTCTGFDYISSESIGLKLFSNNVKRIYRNGTELFSATYQYDDNNYPIRMSYTNLNGNVSGVELITYTE